MPDGDLEMLRSKGGERVSLYAYWSEWRSDRKDLCTKLNYNCSEWLEGSYWKSEGIHSQLGILKDEGEGKLCRETLEINLDGACRKWTGVLSLGYL